MKNLPAVKLLLVDDLDENILALAALLRSDKVELLTAKSGPEALELLLIHDVALALLDVQMPDMDGFELAELMRGSQRTAHVPIIFLTAGSQDAQRVFRGYEVGAVDFLFKPLDPVLLGHKVSTFVALHRQKMEAERLTDEVREMLRLNELFTAAVSHDLRSPLSSVLMGASLLEKELLKDADGDQQTKRILGRIRSSATRMNGMLDHLYDLARARLGGGLNVSPEEMSFQTVIDKVVDELRLSFPDRKIVLDVDRAPLSGSWDEERLCQVLANLLSNALRHGKQSEDVQIRVRGSSDHVTFEVHNGGSIPADFQPHLFDPFRRGSSRSGDNLGLGLYIVREIVLAHGGTIEVVSSEELGTTFTVTLPRTFM